MSQKQGGRGGPAAAKGKKPGKRPGEEKSEDTLQAVVIADSFEDRFRPFSLEKPRCLLPLANTPLIEYTLEYLALNGVQEVFVYCGAHEEQIVTYIQDSPRWSPTSRISPFASLEFIRVSDARSVGDFLRDLDTRGVIGGDFILVHGDLVANIPLDGILAKHRARKEANREAIMTLVLRSGGQEEHRTKTHGITPIFAMESPTGRCLHYEEMHPLQQDHYLSLDPEILKHGDVEIRSDLIDCGIDICTPDVLALWSESFDYELPRKNFLHGVLKDWELNGKLIYSEILDEGYAARASNLQMYDAITKDILGRWTFPFVPDSNLVAGQSYRMSKLAASLEDGVRLGAGSEVTNSVVGRDTSIGAKTTVSNSVVGRRAKIGTGTRIENSYIWDDVTIGDGVSVINSVIASNAVLGSRSFAPEGSLLSFGVHVDDAVYLPATPTTVLSLLDRNGKPAKSDAALVGPSGKGSLFQDADDDEDGEGGDDADPAALQKSLIYSLVGYNISSSSISTLATHDSVDSDEVDSQVASLQQAASERTRLSSFASDDSGSAGVNSASFHQDAVHGLLDALRADDSGGFDSAKLEFMGLRFSNNASDNAVRRAVAAAFARRAAELLTPEHGGLETTKAAERALAGKKSAPKFISEVGVAGEVPEQVEFVLALQKALLNVRQLETAKAGALLAAMLQQLYSLDVLEEDGILTWWADARAAEGESMTTVKEKCRVLVEWLENADEEDSDEEDDDDDDE